MQATGESVAFANLAQRFLASAIDWVFSYLALIPLVAIFSVARDFFDESRSAPSTAIHESSIADLWWLPVVAAMIIAYLAFFYAHSQSPGMKVAGIRLIDPSTGHEPNGRQAVAKAFFAVILGLSAFLLLVSGFSDAPEGLNAVDWGIIYGAAAVFVASVVGRIRMLWDPKRQTIFDKVAGLVVVKAARKAASV
jgi:uncharacterized RDD family membrane protein YckC